MSTETPFLSIAEWRERHPANLDVERWRRYIDTMVDNMPAETVMQVRPSEDKKTITIKMQGQSGSFAAPTFTAQTTLIPADDVVVIDKINSARSGNGHHVFFAQLAASSEAGFERAHLRTQIDGTTRWAYWGMPLNYDGGGPNHGDNDRTTISFADTLRSNLASINNSAVGRRLLSRLEKRNPQALTHIAHIARVSKDIAEKISASGAWYGVADITPTSRDMHRMFRILWLHHKRSGTTPPVKWRPLPLPHRPAASEMPGPQVDPDCPTA